MTVYYVCFCCTLKIIKAKQLNEVILETITFKRNDLIKMSLDRPKILISRHVYKNMQ